MSSENDYIAPHLANWNPMKYLLLFCIILISCTHKEESFPVVLSEAESFMWEYPDSALLKLRSVSQPSSLDEKVYATWCLLLVQARDKVYGRRLPDSLNIPSSEDLIQTALTYFKDSNDLKRKAQAYYYEGRLLEHKDEYPEAVSCFLKSKSIMERLEEPLFSYLITQSLGNIYRRQDLYAESLLQLKAAYRYALDSKNGERVSYALSEIGRTFTEAHRFDSALYYFDRSLINAQEIGDLSLQAMAMGELGVVYRELGRYDSSLSYLRKELALKKENKSFFQLPQVYLKLGKTFVRSGEMDSAKMYFEKSLQTDNLYTIEGAYYALYDIDVKQGNYKEAIKYNEQHLIYADSLSRINHSRELSGIQAKYDYEKLRNINNELKVKKAKQEQVGLIIIIFLSGIALVYQYCLLRKEKLLVVTKEEVRHCNMRIEENEIKLKKNEQLIISLYDQLSKVNEIRLNRAALLLENKRLQDKISRISSLNSSRRIQLRDQIPYFDWLKGLKETPSYLIEKDWRLIMDWMDLQYNNFIVRLRQDFLDFTNLDKQYCCLIKMGFTTAQIATFMASSPNSVTKQKQRIKQRIKNSDLASSNERFSLDEYLKNY